MNHTALACTAIASLAILGSALLLAGPLDPPAGPVGSTLKTLAEVEPRTAISAANTPGDSDSLFRITQPGSYYLTGNVTGLLNKFGIEIAANGVTIDLSGFELVGVGGNFPGIATTIPALTNITIRNGTVRAWGGDGIDLVNFGPAYCRVERVRAASNGGTGIAMGFGAAVVDCDAWSNGQSGIRATGGGVIRGSNARANNIGIFVGTASVHNCSASGNTQTGVLASLGSTVVATIATGNAGSGFTAAGSRVADCTAYSNGVGIEADAGATVENCAVLRNSADGILVASDCTIRGNACDRNGLSAAGAGIHATGDDNRIEANQCSGADLGIWVQGSTNVILRNTCAGNTSNWLLAANNIFGSIVDRSAIVTGSVSGNAAAGTTATTDPSANFTH